MKFNGQSAVEVHPHSNLDELKAVTSISFYIRVDPDKDPIEDRFLLYLGDKQVSTSKKSGPESGEGIYHSFKHWFIQELNTITVLLLVTCNC